MSTGSFRKPLKVAGLTLLFTVAFAVIGSAIVSVTYKKAILKYMQGYLGEHLLTELSMDDMRIRFLKGFPKTTIEISNAVLLSGKDFSRRDFVGSYADTLLHAKSLFLQFNLVKVINKQYELKKIEVLDGTVNILLDKKGRNNLNIWKSSDKTGKEYAVNLRNIEINNTHVRVILLKQKFALDARSQKTRFKGNFTRNILSGETRGNVLITSMNVKNSRLLHNATATLALNIVYGGERFRISDGKVQLNKAVANVKGDIKTGKGSTIDLSVDIPRFGLDEVMSLMPDTRFSTGNYEFGGNGKLHLIVKGELSRQDRLIVQSEFQLDHGTAKNNTSRTSLHNLHMRGRATGTKSSNFRLQIDTLNAQLGKGNIQGTFSLNNLKTLLFTSRIHALIDLEALKDFFGLDSVGSMSGKVLSDFTASGSLKQLSDSSQSIDLLEKGTFVFQNAGFTLKQKKLAVENISGKALWDKSLKVDSLSLTINEYALFMSGTINGLRDYMFHNGVLESSLNITTDNIDISKYLKRSSKVSSSGKDLTLFPPHIDLKAHIKTNRLTAGKFEATDVSVNVRALKDSLLLDQFVFTFPDGSIKGTAMVKVNSGRTLSVICNAEPYKINIQQLFFACNNFTQHFIVDKNIKGLLGGSVNFYAQWDSALIMIPSSVVARGDFQITNGELLQFEPMLKLSKYIDVDELKHIRFQTLKNTFRIQDRMVDIPEMDIHSTAFNISVAGMHSFDNEFDYRLRVLLSEVLFNKARKKKKEIDEFLVEETRADQTTIPLIIAGTPSHFDVKFDRKKAFSLTRNKGKEENKEEPVIKSSDKNIRIEWEEPEKQPEKKSEKSESNPSDVVIEWED